MVALLGPPTSHQSVVASLALNTFKLPIVSTTASSPALSDKSLYPTFSRLQPSDAYQGVIMARLVNYFGWKRVAVLSTSESYGSSLATVFSKECKRLNISVVAAQSYSIGVTQEDLREPLSLIKASNARIIVLFAVAKTANVIQMSKMLNMRWRD